MIFNKTFLYGPLREVEDGETSPGSGTETDAAKIRRLEEENKKLKDKATNKKPIAGVSEAWAEYTSRLKAAQDPLTKIVDATMKIQKANEELVKKGGDFYQKFAPGQEYHQAIQTLVRDSQDFFGNAEAGIAAFTGLGTGMKSFMAISSDAQASIGKTTMFMTQLGFRAEDLAKSMENQAMAFGASEDQLNEHALTMAKVSNTLFIEPAQLMRDFDKAQTEFAYNSDKTMQVFVAMEEQAKKTGLSFSTMAGAFGDQMDTFQGVSGIAGKLNAILGSSVFNPLELLNMDEAQRAAAIRKGIQDSPMLEGKDLKDLGKFELKAIAKGLNMSVLDTRKLLQQEGEVRNQMQKEVEGRINAQGGVDGQGMDLQETNQELARMQDTLRNLRFSAENLAIDTQKMAAGALDITLGTMAQPLGLIGDIQGRHFDMLRLTEAITLKVIDADQVFGKSIDEAMKLVLEAQNTADSPFNRAPGGAMVDGPLPGLDDPNFRNFATTAAGMGWFTAGLVGLGPDNPVALGAAAIGSHFTEKITESITSSIDEKIPDAAKEAFKNALAVIFTDVTTDKQYISNLVKAANDERMKNQ